MLNGHRWCPPICSRVCCRLSCGGLRKEILGTALLSKRKENLQEKSGKENFFSKVFFGLILVAWEMSPCRLLLVIFHVGLFVGIFSSDLFLAVLFVLPSLGKRYFVNVILVWEEIFLGENTFVTRLWCISFL